MNTHILISIKDIEEFKKELKNETSGDKYEDFYLQGKLRAIQYLENIGKQISLDEKDIEDKALEYFKRAEPEVWANYAKLFNAQSDNLKRYKGDKSYILQAYKQALKDLL